MRTFSAADAARECGVSRPTITRAAAAGRIEGAVRDDAGAWVLPLDGLLGAGFHPGRPSPPEDEKARDRDEMVPARIHELELEVLRTEVRAQSARADALERVVAIYERQLEAAPTAAPSAPQPPEQPQPDPIPTPVYVDPPRANVGRFRRAVNIIPPRLSRRSRT
jgi:hypothetical protein